MGLGYYGAQRNYGVLVASLSYREDAKVRQPCHIIIQFTMRTYADVVAKYARRLHAGGSMPS